MPILKLPQYLINKLKAGEIVERPACIVKELIENSLDAGANEIILAIENGGKKLIKISDNGTGIDYSDLALSIERYATSKISTEDDIYNLATYGFRGEALASISQVAKFKLQTKTAINSVGWELSKIEDEVHTKQIPFATNHGTIIYIQDLFFNTPVRFKFLKSESTENKYIQDIFINFALINYYYKFILYKNSKLIYLLEPKDNLIDRVVDIYDKIFGKSLQNINFAEHNITIQGIISDSSLTFPTPANIKIYVNNRPVQDKIIKKAIIEAYARLIPNNEFPMVIIFLNIPATQVDVNVHPKKLEVRFLDSGSIFNLIKQVLTYHLTSNKIHTRNFDFISTSNNNIHENIHEKTINKNNSSYQTKFELPPMQQIINKTHFDIQTKNNYQDNNINYKIIGQLWDSYIILESAHKLYLIDQHALAERISYEKIKLQAEQASSKVEILLTPLTINIANNIDLDDKLEAINKLGFDIALFGEHQVIVYALPVFLSSENVDINKIWNFLFYLEELKIENILDKIWSSQACKTSIKAGQKLSHQEMHNLISTGFQIIKDYFTCPHGRPSFIEISDNDIKKLFARI